MIKFNLVCGNEHEFEGWFATSNDFSRQQELGLLSCPLCENSSIAKALMAPGVQTSRTKSARRKEASLPMAASASPELLEQMRKLRREVEKVADNVGDKFAEEARKIHYGETEKRGIYGQTSKEEATSLREEGIEVFPLPVLPEDKN